PLEHRMLMTATLCLLAFGAVMVYSASSPLGVLSRGGSGAGEFVRYLLFGAAGLAAMHVLSRRGLRIFTPRLVNALLLGSSALLIASGMPMRYVAALAGLAAVCVLLLATAQPYERARLTSFMHPWAEATKAGPGYQAVQGQIAVGSGGLLGVGLGRSVQKIY